jgi:uncharacterized protein YbaP (TraB family)
VSSPLGPFSRLGRGGVASLLVVVLIVWSLACGQGAPAVSSGQPVASVALPPSATSSVSPVVSAPPSASAGASAPVAPNDRPQPFLWEVTKDEKKNHLFGTMHLGTDAEKELHPIVFERLDAATVVVFEADVFDIDPFAAVELALLPPGQTVKDKLSPGRWKILVDRVGGFLMPESTLERFKPWMLVTLVLQDMLPKTDPMDGTLHARAKSQNKQIVFLETVKEQVTMVDKSMDVKLLDDTLGDLPLAEKMLLDLAGAYRAGDLEKLTALSSTPSR